MTNSKILTDSPNADAIAYWAKVAELRPDLLKEAQNANTTVEELVWYEQDMGDYDLQRGV